MVIVALFDKRALRLCQLFLRPQSKNTSEIVQMRLVKAMIGDYIRCLGCRSISHRRCHVSQTHLCSSLLQGYHRNPGSSRAVDNPNGFPQGWADTLVPDRLCEAVVWFSLQCNGECTKCYVFLQVFLTTISVAPAQRKTALDALIPCDCLAFSECDAHCKVIVDLPRPLISNR